jgi:hypothetical protein
VNVFVEVEKVLRSAAARGISSMEDWDLFNYDEKEYLAFCKQQKQCVENGTLFYAGVPSHPHLSVAVCGVFKRNCAINVCRDNNMLTDD